MSNNIEILSNIELEFAEQDTRWQFRAKLDWKTLFRAVTEEEYNEKIIEITEYFSNWSVVIENETWLPYKIKDNKNFEIIIDFYLNKIFTSKEEFFINSSYLESPIWKAKYTSKSYILSEENFKKLEISENEKLKINLLQKLDNISNFTFTTDWYFQELIYAYKILLNEEYSNNIQINNSESITVENWKHKILALIELINEWKKMWNYSLNNLKEKIKLFLINNNILKSEISKWDFIFENMNILKYPEIKEEPKNEKIRDIIKWM